MEIRQEKKMDCLYIVIPAYNEEETIEQVVKEWYPVIEKHDCDGKSRMVVIDDGSKDNTYEKLRKLAEKYPLLEAITKKNEGHGATVLAGYQHALKKHADYVFQTDSDGQTLPEEFEEFWNNRKSYDLIIGYRNKREDGFSRVIVTKVLKLVVRCCFGVWCTDANTPYRLMKADKLAEEIRRVPDRFNLSNVLLTVLYTIHKADILYLPITFRPRQGGINSINIKKICKIGLQAIKDFRVIKKTIKA